MKLDLKLAAKLGLLGSGLLVLLDLKSLVFIMTHRFSSSGLNAFVALAGHALIGAYFYALMKDQEGSGGD